MDKKPSVFPTQEQMANANEQAKILAYEAEKKVVTNEVYTNAIAPDDTPNGHIDAVTMMKRRTEDQMKQRDETGVVQDPSLAETPKSGYNVNEMYQKSEDQMRLRDEQLEKNRSQIQNYQKQAENATIRKNDYSNSNQNMQQNNNMNNNVPPTQPPSNNGLGNNYGQNPSNINPYIIELSQPNYNSPFDVIPLPSEGKLYPNKRANVRVSFMTTADENILTSPNLLQSGEFLEILMNRKMLEPDLRYKNLHVGDRNAIMIWLRATGYGEMYPVTLLDEKGVPFETEVNLNELKTKNLGAEPDQEGLFDFKFSLSKASVKFKLLTCGDVDDIEKMIEKEKADGVPVNNSTTYTMEKTIIEVNGTRDRNVIREFANSIRIRDAKDFTNYIEKIESGIDLNIEVRTPGGGSVKTFLPLNVKFFWPNF